MNFSAIASAPAIGARVAPVCASNTSSRRVSYSRSVHSGNQMRTATNASPMFTTRGRSSQLDAISKTSESYKTQKKTYVSTNIVARSVASGKGAKIIVQGIHLEITDSIKDYCEQKINKAVSHFDLHDVREVDVRCSARGGEKQLGGDITKTTVSVYTKNGVVRSEEEAGDLYASIDAVSDKLERKLRKLKEKKQSQRPGKNKMNPKAATTAAVEAAIESDVEDDMEWQEPVTERFQAVRKCSAGDAAAEMELLGHTFYTFKNIAQGSEVNVVYKRTDGGYGVVVPVDMD